MKLFRFWVRETGTLTFDGATAPASCWGGSNVSLEEARGRAQAKLAEVKARVEGGVRRAQDPDYEVEIREEIIQEINSKNIVSRNRYGALVLNSEDTLIMDIDEAPFRWSALFSFLLPGKPLTKKEIIFEMIRKKAAAYEDLTFRVYETSKGVRVIVTGRVFDPRSSETRKLFRAFHNDPLYAHLCWKQNCFRARLTPKPYRVKCPKHKVDYPRTQEEQVLLENWLKQYEEVSQRFGVCRFVESIGSGGDNRIVSFHDSSTQAHKARKLA